MRLLESEGRELFAKYGINVPRAIVADCVEEAVRAAEILSYPVVIKAQVLAGGRGKAGGIKAAADKTELMEYTRALLGLVIKGEVTRKVLVSERVEIQQELYLGITFDLEKRLPVLMFSVNGGMDIEAVARTSPEKVLKLRRDPTLPLRTYQVIEFLRRSELRAEYLPKVSEVAQHLVELFCKCDATTAEINPLVITKGGQIVALDSKVVIDDAALTRQPFRASAATESTLEKRAKKIGVNYVPLKGNIAVIAGGAGLAMATMDLVAHFGAKPASFLDTGGGISSERMAEALRISLATPGVKGVIINAFGGINNCEMMAKGICQVVDEDRPAAALVVKMRGHSQDEGWRLLDERGIPIVKYGTSEEAVEQVICLVGSC